MKPEHVFGYILSVVLLLGALSFVFPPEGIRLGSYTTLHFPTADELSRPLLPQLSAKKQAVDSILTAAAALKEEKLDSDEPDSVSATDSFKVDAGKIFPLVFPDKSRTALDKFFAKLSRLKESSTRMRVAHYGDSQIEGDRITSYLRFHLQKKFGGGGPGLIPIVQPYAQFSVKHTLSDNWQRFTVISNSDKSKFHDNYGTLMSFSRFTPEDTGTCTDTAVVYKAHAKLSIPRGAYTNNKKFNHIRLFYGNSMNKTAYQFMADGKLVESGNLKRTKSLSTAEIKLAEIPSEIEWKFEGCSSPDFYALSLDWESGISVDNIALRGSSGTIFNSTDMNLLREMYDKMNLQLFILQFGGNTVPYMEDEERCIAYGKWFYRQLQRLKQFKPDASFIVIGPSDMAYKEKEEFISYPNLEHVRNALKEATLKAGGAFWDMYEAMGGKNSMPHWVDYDPPLAATDYVHFTPQGANIIAKMFYASLMHEYELYLKRNKSMKE